MTRRTRRLRIGGQHRADGCGTSTGRTRLDAYRLTMTSRGRLACYNRPGVPMEQTRFVLAGALATAVAALAVLLFAVGRRWFAQFSRGFLLSVMVALAGTGLAIAGVLGVWAYTENRDTLVRQIVTELTHIADIQQNEIREDLRDAQIRLQFFATQLTDDARRQPAAV